jgi:hypothetical protein
MVPAMVALLAGLVIFTCAEAGLANNKERKNFE